MMDWKLIEHLLYTLIMVLVILNLVFSLNNPDDGDF